LAEFRGQASVDAKFSKGSEAVFGTRSNPSSVTCPEAELPRGALRRAGVSLTGQQEKYPALK